MKNTRKTLTGLYYLSYHVNGEVKHQGRVVGTIIDYLLLDTYSWLTGEYWCSIVQPFSKCVEEGWNFYYDEAHWREEAHRKFQLVGKKNGTEIKDEGR